MTQHLNITAYKLAEKYLGIREVPGVVNNPVVMAMLTLDLKWVSNDETPWCAAFVNWICWNLELPRTRDLRARSWLNVGNPVTLAEASQGFDVVILQRGNGLQPGPNVIDAPGHVGFYSSHSNGSVSLLGGNQGNAVSVASFPTQRILGVRRLW